MSMELAMPMAWARSDCGIGPQRTREQGILARDDANR
jgi:hypothetical protein